MLILTRILASKAVRRALLVLGLSLLAAVVGLPPELVDLIANALSQ